MNKARAVPYLCAVALFVTACASTPLSVQGVDSALTPALAMDPATQVQGQRILWGGIIVHSENLDDASRIELLAYPLDRRQRPDTDAEPFGRVLITQAGYLETANYRPGRALTALGTLAPAQAGRIGAAAYRYPVMQARQLHLWPTQRRGDGTSVHFGIGVILH